jgi:site-specific recombinase XerD
MRSVGVRAIQRILGRSDVHTTEAYTHVGDQITRILFIDFKVPRRFID